MLSLPYILIPVGFRSNIQVLSMNNSTKNETHPSFSTAQTQSDSSEEEQMITVEKPADKTIDKQLREVNGPKGLEPTRYGDWEANGRCYDF